MKWAIKSMVLFCCLTVLSCSNRQIKETSETQPKVTVTIGDTVAGIGKNIRGIIQDRQGYIWLASDGDGLFRYDGKTILHFTEKDGLCGNVVQSLQQEKDGSIAVCSGTGSCSFDGKQFSKFQSVDNQNETPQTSGLTKNYSQTPYAVYCTLHDSKGNIWYGTESRGVCKYDGNTYTWLDDQELGLAVRCIFEDRNGNIWIGNNGNGLFCYDGKALTNFTKEHHLENPDFQTTLQGKPGTLARVWAIAEDRNRSLWIGTVDAGLWKFDGKKLVNYTTKDGLISNSILGLCTDNKGNLWIGTTDGVTIFNGNTFRRF